MVILDLEKVKLPRVNNRYNKNFSLTSDYRNGKNNLIRQINKTVKGCPIIEPPYAVDISVGTHYDIDSFVKPLMDAMQEAGVIDNDKNVSYLSIKKVKVKRTQDNWIIVELNHYEVK